MIARRTFLASGLILGAAPRIAFARAATNRRLVFILQRGAADGLGTIAPVGDPDFERQRGALAQPFADAKRLDSMFAVHPVMTELAGLYAAREALFVHAVASPYRERSHFDGQNALETGSDQPYAIKDGWLNRLLALLPPDEARAIAVAATVPMALRGRADVSSYAPSALPDASDDMIARVTQLYAGDEQLHSIWARATETRALTSDLAAEQGRNAAATGALAARLIAPANGARIAMIETGGWDTHATQAARLGGQLKGLDAMIGAIGTGLGPVWRDTLVVVATEFGRTVRVNGTAGTDHGTASAAMLAGGTVAGGRVVADWPGLSDTALHDGRDLKPTGDVNAVVAAAIAGHFALEDKRVLTTLFPASRGAMLPQGLIRA